MLRMSLRHKRLTIQQFIWIYVGTLACMMLVYLGITGRLHWLFAVVGAALPFVGRALPVIIRLIGALSLFRSFKGSIPSFGGGSRASAGQRSELNTRFLAMELDHDSGEMDGEVLEGPFKGRRLSDLSLSELLTLYDACRTDPDSSNVLGAYLDRVHPDWSEQEDIRRREEVSESANISERQAWEILGLEPGAGKKEIVDAHRRLIQRLHPDRGGSSYLAARINEAKKVLLGDDKRGQA